jgi:hypothetical protein
VSNERDLPQGEHESVDRVDAPTITDAHLVRYVDGELSPATRTSLSAILEQRADLAARVEQLERRSTRLSALLSEVSPDATQLRDSAAAMRPHVLRSATRRSWWLRLPPGMKAAAAIALLFGLVFIVPDARAWVLERVRAAAEAIGVVARQSAPEAPVVAPTEPARAAVTITFTAPRDTLDVSVHQAAGVLIVRRASGADASAEAAGVDARFTVGPSALQIDGPASADAVYTLTVPPPVTVVRLQRAAGAITVHAVPLATRELRIELAPR